MKGTLLGLLLAAVVATTVTVGSGPTGPTIRPAAAFGTLSPQGGTITGITTSGTSGLIGGCTSGVCTLSLPQTCSNGQVETWNSGTSSWGCGSVAINSAANNVITKSNGTNLVASDITDNGTTIDLTNGAAKMTVAVSTGATTIAGQYTFLNRQICTNVCTGTGTTTYTPTTGARGAIIRMCGAGGGGGGATGGASSDSTGGGGASGAYIEFHVGFANSTITGGAWTQGTAGTAGTAGNNNGGTGGDSTLVVNGATATAKGGTGGIGNASNNTGGQSLGGTVQTGSTITVGSLDSIGGWQGGAGTFVDTSFAVTGFGGSSPFGVGGSSVSISQASGNAAVGFCAGGSGGLGTTSSQTGGAGAAGKAVIDEYF